MRSLAKRLVSPDLVCPDHYAGPDWVLTDGPAVAELNASAGFAPDPQQELGLDLIFAVGENGLPASFAVCVICCRQNLKTGLLKQAAVGWLFVTDERLIVWSAHEMDTTRQAHGDLASLITESPALSRRLPKTPNQGIYDANGQERIELDTGQVLRFKARTLSGGRGLSGDKVILDEGFALKAAMMGALLPTMTARPHGQVVYASSAGKADSDVLRDVRDRGRAGASPRLSYLEWLAPHEDCADQDCRHPKDAPARGLDCALDREHLWRAANPTITTGRIDVQTIADLRQELPPEEFARESLGWWDEQNQLDSVFAPGAWGECRVDPPPVPPDPACLGIAADLDQTRLSLGASTDAAVPHLGSVLRMRVDRGGRERFVAEVKRIQDERHCNVIIDAKGPASFLIPDLEDAGVDLIRGNLDDFVQACADIKAAVNARAVEHAGYEDLDAAVAAAGWRTAGERRVLSRKGGDIDALEAVTWAMWGAGRPPPTSVYEERGVLVL